MVKALCVSAVVFLALNALAFFVCVFVAGLAWAWTDSAYSADLYFRLAFFFLISTAAAGIMAIPAIKCLWIPP